MYVPITKHGQSRIQQRGIPKDLVEILWEYGRTRWANGACITDMDRKSLRTYLARDPQPKKQFLSQLGKLYLVDAGDQIITVGRKNKSWRRKFN